MTGKSSDNSNTKNIEIAVPLKYLINFLRTLGMALINCEFNFILAWSGNCVTTNSRGK